MARKQAVLLDLYDTALSCDFTAHDLELPRIAGVAQTTWTARTRDLAAPIMDGSISLATAFADVMTRAGGSANPDLVETMVRRDQELLLQETVLYPDTIPFLQRVRARGMKTALISNCAENTMALVDHLELTRWSTKSSCRARSAPPSLRLRSTNMRSRDWAWPQTRQC